MEEGEDACPHMTLEELEIPQGSTGMLVSRPGHARQSFGPTTPVAAPQTSDPLRRAPEMFPESILHTNRLILRPFNANDIPDTHASCADALTQRWLMLPKPYTLGDATNWCTTTAHTLRDSGDGIQFAVTDAYTKRLMGQVVLKKTDWRALVSEVGYWYRPGPAATASQPKQPVRRHSGSLPTSSSNGWNCEPPRRTPHPRNWLSKPDFTLKAHYGAPASSTAVE
ncbi:GNAT family N-acetyltransferase [Streptomyces sp. NPDC024089]|uniref:GNAT family N-acetyltransferase n=1 Tax=Streptomyces sp. NPDC024089 TaxID=3154328 RepID=UPI0033F7BCDB